MKTIILCILKLSIGLVVKAQSNTASLNITLTDVQSIKFDSPSLDESAAVKENITKNENLQVLNRSTAQIRKISSETSEYARLYKEIYSGSAVSNSSSSNGNVYTMAVNRTDRKTSALQKKSNLVIYQVDPR